MIQKKIVNLIVITCLTINGYSQIDSLKLKEEIDYDARLFMTRTQINSFNKLYPDFDSSKVEKDWEWKDVDPLGFFSKDENRFNRRELFLFEHNPYSIKDNNLTNEHIAFKILIEKQIDDSEVLIDKSNAKIRFLYTGKYEDFRPSGMYSLLEKISDLGLDWAQAGGDNLYIYNGNILLGKYKSGYVSIAKLNIDKPNKKYLDK
ncbi:MAG: hypothetical protein QNL00_07435 [Saprospiraceae bacterium]